MYGSGGMGDWKNGLRNTAAAYCVSILVTLEPVPDESFSTYAKMMPATEKLLSFESPPFFAVSESKAWTWAGSHSVLE